MIKETLVTIFLLKRTQKIYNCYMVSVMSYITHAILCIVKNIEIQMQRFVKETSIRNQAVSRNKYRIK